MNGAEREFEFSQGAIQTAAECTVTNSVNQLIPTVVAPAAVESQPSSGEYLAASSDKPASNVVSLY